LLDSTSIDFTYNDGANTITAAIIDEYVQDLVAALLIDSTTIDFTYNDGANTLTADVIQSFAYAWTNDHSWSTTNPRLILTRTSAGTNEKSWGIAADGATTFSINAQNDALNANRVILRATKLAADFNLSNIQIGNSNVAHTYTFPSAGTATFGGKIVTPASVAGFASLRLPHGAAPTTPADGDIWTTTAGLFVRINGATVGPLT
jgi:hypothetical protein